MGEFFFGREVYLGLSWPRGLSWTLLAERFFIALSAGIHLGEFFLGREVSLRLSWPRGFFVALSAGIHMGEFFLGREVWLGSCVNDLSENF